MRISWPNVNSVLQAVYGRLHLGNTVSIWRFYSSGIVRLDELQTEGAHPMDHAIIRMQTSHPVDELDATLVRKNLYQPIPRALPMSAPNQHCVTYTSPTDVAQRNFIKLGVHVSQSEKQTTTPD